MKNKIKRDCKTTNRRSKAKNNIVDSIEKNIITMVPFKLK
jgi:hypothetical protein